jgi:hypothetical protein
MPITFIDYTPFYYTSLARTSVPPVTTGKFVQIRRGQELFLVLSPKELTKYHANIVERFCMDKSIEGTYDAKREKFLVTDRSWQVVGGGKFERDEHKKTIKFYDNSMAYGKFDVTGMRATLAALPEFAGFSITMA